MHRVEIQMTDNLWDTIKAKFPKTSMKWMIEQGLVLFLNPKRQDCNSVDKEIVKKMIPEFMKLKAEIDFEDDEIERIQQLNKELTT